MKNIRKLIWIMIFIVFFIVGCNKKVDNSMNESIKNDKIITIDNISEKENSSNINVSNKVNDKENNDDKEIIEIENEEIKTIVIDPGHSSIGNFEKEPIAPDSNKTKYKDVLGATGVFTNIPEHKTTVSIGLLLRDKLIDMGYNVVLTKSEVDKSISNIERAQIGNDNNADLVIRIHADSSNDKNINGASILVPSKNKYTDNISNISMAYGKKIIDIYTEKLSLKNRGCIYRDDMTGFNWSDVPVVILEMGFLSNMEDDKFISNKNNHDNIADAIAIGIDKCFE